MKSCSNSFEHSRTINVHLPHIFALLQYKFLFPHLYVPLPHPYIPIPHLYIPLPHPYRPLPHLTYSLPHLYRPLPHPYRPLPHLYRPLPHPYTPLPHPYRPLPHPYVPFRTRFAGYLSADEGVFYVGHVLTFVKHTFHTYPRRDNTSDNGHSAEGWCVRDMREYPFWARGAE